MKSFYTLAFLGLASAQKGRHTTDPVYTCPAPFELQGKTCVRQTQTPAAKYCPQGILKGDVCILPAPREQACPPGTTPTANGCTITEQIPAEKFCPPNTHDIGGECQTYTVTGIVEVCARGVLVGGQCELSQTAQPTVTKACPVGYEQAKGGCWKHEQMDCTPPHVGKRMLQAKGAALPAVGKGYARPIPAFEAPRYIPQPAKLAVTAKQCEVKLEAPLHTTTQCPANMEQINGQCITKTYEPTTIECSLGAPHLCFPAETKPANLRCPAGYQRNGEICTKTVNIPKNSFCPPGTTEGKGGCQRTTPALPKCPPGTQLSGDVCLGQETVQPTVQVTMTCQGKNCFRN